MPMGILLQGKAAAAMWLWEMPVPRSFGWKRYQLINRDWIHLTDFLTEKIKSCRLSECVLFVLVGCTAYGSPVVVARRRLLLSTREFLLCNAAAAAATAAAVAAIDTIDGLGHDQAMKSNQRELPRARHTVYWSPARAIVVIGHLRCTNTFWRAVTIFILHLRSKTLYLPWTH